MSEFVGRTGALRVYSYPEAPRGAALGLLARNFAAGPPGNGSTPVTDTPAPIDWTTIESGGGGVNVPITPRSTGIVIVRGVVAVHNVSNVPVTAIAAVTFDGSSAIPAEEGVTLQAGNVTEQFAEIPFVVRTTSPLPLGATAQVQVVVAAGTGTTAVLDVNASSIDVQEVSTATG